MKRIDTSTKSVDLFGAGKHGYKDGDKALGIAPTQLNASSLNALQEEIAGVIEATGAALDPNSNTQLAKSIQSGKLMAANAGGTADAITASYTPDITALTNGMTLSVRAGSANATTTPTFTPATGTIAAKTIVKGNGLALVAGDIAGAGHRLILQYDSTLDKWVLANPATGINAVGRLIATQTFTASGTYTPNAIAKYIEIEVIGGGGGGGSAAQTAAGQIAAGGGGGAGGRAVKRITSPTSQTITIGAAGASGNSGTAGGVGGTSSFGAIVSAVGGTGGPSGTSGTGGAGPGALGGTASGGDINVQGAAGHGAYGIATPLAVLSGKGADSVYGSGGNAVSGFTTGGAATGYGAAGAGGSCTPSSAGAASGGAGSGGIIIIKEYS